MSRLLRWTEGVPGRRFAHHIYSWVHSRSSCRRILWVWYKRHSLEFISTVFLRVTFEASNAIVWGQHDKNITSKSLKPFHWTGRPAQRSGEVLGNCRLWPATKRRGECLMSDLTPPIRPKRHFASLMPYCAVHVLSISWRQIWRLVSKEMMEGSKVNDCFTLAPATMSAEFRGLP
jgi:hypothetical protein